jgi:hypothetical protein
MTTDQQHNTNGRARVEDAITGARETMRERAPRRRVGLDIRGLALSALVAATIVFVLRRADRDAAR